MFRRRNRSAEDGHVEKAESAVEQPEQVRTFSGPVDITQFVDDGVTRLDLGSLRVPGAEGMEIRLEVDQTSDAVVAVTVIDGASAMQVMPFAAPRQEGIWDDVRAEMYAGLAAQGDVAEAEGPFGIELRSTVSVQVEDGSVVQQPVRFLGVDGPRWFVRAAISGEAGGLEAAPGLEAVLRSTVVVRGSEPMAPGDPLVLTFPSSVPEGIIQGEAPEPPASRTTLPMPERGPEITEIR